MGRKIAIACLALVLILVAAFLLGPRVAVDTIVTFDPAVIGNDPEAYLANVEAAVPGIRQGLAKEIVWADPATKAKTSIAVVYIHGFSASKGEVRPLPDIVAAGLKANLFYTRLTGHGRDGAAMAEGSINAWVNDYAEALAIGRAIGNKVLVIGTSTGASLAVQATATDAASQGVAAIAMISPNFGVQASGAEILTMPWGGLIAEMVIGKERGFEPSNDAQRLIWTFRYPTVATLPMAALTRLAREAPVEATTIPALFIFSDADTVVRPDLTREIAARWGGPHELVPVEKSGDPDNHVIAGDALSPETTQVLARRIVVWAQAILD